MQSLDKALMAFKLIRQRKAIDPVLFSIEGLSTIADFFLIASGHSTRQVQAMAGYVKEKMKLKEMLPLGVEGEGDGNWILIDYGDLVIHLFFEPQREFYDLEGLWIEAPRIDLP